MHTDTSPSPPPSSTASPVSSSASAGLPQRPTRRSNLLWLAVWALAISTALVLIGLAALLYFPSAPTTTRLSLGSIEHAGNELLYRACVREARMRSLPVKPYPRESEHVSFAHEGKQLLKRTETLEADVTDMSVENGCQVTLHSNVRVETTPAADSASFMRKMTQEQEGRQQALTVSLEEEPAVASRPDAPPPCILTRDMALQSHFMLLNLCVIERAPHAGQSPAAARKQSARVIWRPNT